MVVLQKSQVDRMERTTCELASMSQLQDYQQQCELAAMSQLQHSQQQSATTSSPQAAFDACNTTTFC